MTREWKILFNIQLRPGLCQNEKEINIVEQLGRLHKNKQKSN